MTFILEFFTRNSVLNEPGCELEIKRILHRVGEQVENGYTKEWIYDVNGNLVGEWGWTSSRYDDGENDEMGMVP